MRQLVCTKNNTKPPAQNAVGAITGDLIHYQRLLKIDLAKIKEVGDIAKKTELKKVLIKQYLPFINQYLSSGACYKNNVAVYCMIWLFDIGDIEQAVQLALVLIKQKIQHLPDNFGRSLQTFVCHSVHDWAIERLQQKQTASPHLNDVCVLIENWDVDDLTASKFYAITARHYFAVEDWANCIVWADKAESLNPKKAGIKTMRESAYKALMAKAQI